MKRYKIKAKALFESNRWHIFYEGKKISESAQKARALLLGVEYLEKGINFKPKPINSLIDVNNDELVIPLSYSFVDEIKSHIEEVKKIENDAWWQRHYLSSKTNSSIEFYEEMYRNLGIPFNIKVTPERYSNIANEIFKGDIENYRLFNEKRLVSYFENGQIETANRIKAFIFLILKKENTMMVDYAKRLGFSRQYLTKYFLPNGRASSNMIDALLEELGILISFGD